MCKGRLVNSACLWADLALHPQSLPAAGPQQHGGAEHCVGLPAVQLAVAQPAAEEQQLGPPHLQPVAGGHGG